jgi:hypothetical protein
MSTLDSLKKCAEHAVKELKKADEWEGFEDDVDIQVDFEPKDPSSSPLKRALILFILKGEMSETIVANFEIKLGADKGQARLYIDEIKQQIREYFLDHEQFDDQFFTIDDVKNEFPRLYNEFENEEETVLSMIILKERSIINISKIFQRPPIFLKRKALKYQTSKNKVDETKAVFLLGKEIYCNTCNHRSMLLFDHLHKIAARYSETASTLSKEKLLSAVSKFSCVQCKAKTAIIRM